MKIYVAHSSGFDFRNKLYDPIRKSQLNKDHQITLPHQKSAKTQNSFRVIQKSDLVIAEVSYPSTGLGIELGWANILKVPTVGIYKKGAKVSSSLQIIIQEFIEYSAPDQMIKKLISYLSR